jgi:hypothetical protein
MGGEEIGEDPVFIGGMSPELAAMLMAHFDKHFDAAREWSAMFPPEIPGAFRRRASAPRLTGMARSAYPGLVTGMIR